ncbi:PROSC family protein [Megaselia abdita]
MLRRMSSVDVKAGIISVLERVEQAYSRRPPTITTLKPQLVAVSKTKPVEAIIEAYSTGQRYFGENYVNELSEKASNEEILRNCPEIKWHFIGHLQTNKINKVLKSPGIDMIETVDSEKLANNLDNAWGKIAGNDSGPLKVLIQVNSSAEAEKNGVEPSKAPALYKHIKEKCSNLDVRGVMTIGAFGFDYSKGPNPDFVALMKCHAQICEESAVRPEDLQVSMGMSDDFEKAIEMGSTIVRVGSSIFGYRAKKAAATATAETTN